MSICVCRHPSATDVCLLQWLSEPSLDPNAIHFQHSAAIHLQPTIHQILFLNKSRCLCHSFQLVLCEEVDHRAVSAHVEVILQTLSRLKPQLSQIISSVIPEQQNPARFQVLVALAEYVWHPEISRIHNKISERIIYNCSTYFLGSIADNTKMETIISALFSANGMSHSSCVTSRTNTCDRSESNSSWFFRISIALEEKSLPNTFRPASVLYFSIGRIVLPTPQPISNIVRLPGEDVSEDGGANSGNSVKSQCRSLKNLLSWTL